MQFIEKQNSKSSFRFVFVKGLAHTYATGLPGHPMEAAKLHWAWMKNFSLP